MGDDRENLGSLTPPVSHYHSIFRSIDQSRRELQICNRMRITLKTTHTSDMVSSILTTVKNFSHLNVPWSLVIA